MMISVIENYWIMQVGDTCHDMIDRKKESGNKLLQYIIYFRKNCNFPKLLWKKSKRVDESPTNILAISFFFDIGISL